MATNPNGAVERDPNGLAGGLVIVILALAGIFNVAIDDETATNIANVAASVTTAGGYFWARRHTFAPATVRALTPETVGEAGELPTLTED